MFTMRDVNLRNLPFLVSQSYQNDVDFRYLYNKMTTSHKVGLFASKVFIFISTDGNFVSLHELNFIDRFFRWCGWYTDSVFSREQLASIRGVFATSIGASFTQSDEIETYKKQIEKVTDISSLDQYIKTIEEKCKDPNNIVEKWNRLLKYAKETRAALVESNNAVEVIERVKDGIPGKLLDVVLEIIKTHEKSKPLKKKAIEEFLTQYLKSTEVAQESVQNIYIFLSLLNIDLDVKKLQCLGLEVPESIETRVGTKLNELEKDFALLYETKPKTWGELLERYNALSALDTSLNEFRSSIRSETALLMRDATKARLEFLGVHQSLIDEYLNDPERGETRVFEHTNLFLDSHRFAQFSKRLRQKIHRLQDKMVAKIDQEYHPKHNAGGGDCFFYSCNDLTPQENRGMAVWRKSIAERLRMPEYLPLIEERLKTDEMALQAYFERGDTVQEQYCNWISKLSSWGSGPELKAFSDMVERPVIVVQKLGGNDFHWSGWANLDFDAEPLIFINHSAVHYEAMILRSDK